MKNKKHKSLEKNKMLAKYLVGKLLSKLRGDKSLRLFGDEYSFSPSSIGNIEKGFQDVQITNLWRIVNSHGLKMSEFFQLVESELPEGWSFVDE